MPAAASSAGETRRCKPCLRYAGGMAIRGSLTWKRAFGRYCLSCPGCSKKHSPDLSPDELCAQMHGEDWNKKDTSEGPVTDTQLHAGFMDTLEAFEEKHKPVETTMPDGSNATVWRRKAPKGGCCGDPNDGDEPAPASIADTIANNMSADNWPTNEDGGIGLKTDTESNMYDIEIASVLGYIWEPSAYWSVRTA